MIDLVRGVERRNDVRRVIGEEHREAVARPSRRKMARVKADSPYPLHKNNPVNAGLFLLQLKRNRTDCAIVELVFDLCNIIRCV